MMKANRRAALRFDIATQRLAPAFKADIVDEKNRYIDAQIAAWRKTGGMSSTVDNDHAANMQAIFRKHYAKIIKVASNETPKMVVGIKISAPLELKKDWHESALRVWFTKHGGERAAETARTTRGDIRRLLTEAFDAGDPETEVLRRGMLAKGLSAWRADTIARTETHTAAGFASDYTARQIAQDGGFTLEKAWVSTSDDRTREIHADMDGNEYIGQDEAFDVGGESLEYPGDPSGSAENTINCRCSVVRRVAL